MTTPDLKELLKMAQEMQKSMKEAHEDLSRQKYAGTSGSESIGTVQVTMDGKHGTAKVKIDQRLLPKASTEEIEILEDLIAAANNAAVRKIEQASEQKMVQLTKKLGLPGGPEGETQGGASEK